MTGKRHIVLGLHKDPWHNSGAALIAWGSDGCAFASLSEERCNRKKDSRDFPQLSIEACMQALNVTSLNDIDLVVLDYICDGTDWRKDYYKNPCITDCLLSEIDPSKIRIMNHHLAHAYAVYYSSEFETAAVLIVDGRGSDKETQSLFVANPSEIRLVDQTAEIGIGLLYAGVTQKVGFKLLQEGKTMGLAPYGRSVNEPVFQFPKDYRGIVTNYESVCIEDSYDMTIDHRPIVTFDDKARGAFEVQEETEQALLHLAKYARETTGEPKLCLSGGVALNSVANYKIQQSGIFDEIFINPAASDTGIPLGAALYGIHGVLGLPKNYKSIPPYLGPEYDQQAVDEAIRSFEGYEVVFDNAHTQTAQMLYENKILSVFHGRSETGPRALGNRSILMSPLNAENKDVLNARVKFRESFRPFAPAILAEHCGEYFEIETESPYMLLVPQVKEDKKEAIPAVVHVDGSARLQTVAKSFNPNFYRLIEEFYQLSGVPVILNTSFNVAGEPIVETPVDAIKCFLGTSIDALLIENYLLVKNPG